MRDSSIFVRSILFHKRNQLLPSLVLVFCLTLILILYFINGTNPSDNVNHRNKNIQFVKYFPSREFVEKEIKLILVWTPMFFSYGYIKDIKEVCARAKRCEATLDRSKIKEADAVFFHFYDIWFWVGLPTYRHPSQVWVLWSTEPTSRLWKDYKSFAGVFNWTLTYRQDASIFAPQGMIRKLEGQEKKEMAIKLQHRNFFKERPYFIAMTISDCYDQSHRYRLVKELRKYLQIDVYGKCGNLTCKQGDPVCETKLSKYKFMFQFENSYCKDYITEKYWHNLRKDGVSIVNWKNSQKNHPVARYGFINLFDFPSLKQAADYIKMVSRNETLYNSYLRWKWDYKVTDTETPLSGVHYLCDALHDKSIPAQVITDLDGWIRNDTCKKGTVSYIVSKWS